MHVSSKQAKARELTEIGQKTRGNTLKWARKVQDTSTMTGRADPSESLVCVCVSVCVCKCVCVCVCVCVCESSLVCMIGVIFVYADTVFGFYGYSFFILSWMFPHDYLDTCCLSVLYACVLVFAPVQCNRAYFTWTGALEIRSLFY